LSPSTGATLIHSITAPDDGKRSLQLPMRDNRSSL
jgi:hypothetical protein